MRLSLNYFHNTFSAIVYSIGILKKIPYAFRDQPNYLIKLSQYYSGIQWEMHVVWVIMSSRNSFSCEWGMDS